jgi:hypothetical protein
MGNRAGRMLRRVMKWSAGRCHWPWRRPVPVDVERGLLEFLLVIIELEMWREDSASRGRIRVVPAVIFCL